MHLGVRAADGDDDPAARAIELGVSRLDHSDGLPSEVFIDPSGNEVCIRTPSSTSPVP